MSARRSLTAAQVAAIQEEGVHWVAPSLYLQVRPGQGTRSWMFRYSRNGGNQWMGLNSTGDKSFTEARDEAAMLRVLVRRGEDPIAQKRGVEAAAKPKAKAKAPSFADCAEKYIEAHRSGWKNDKHIAQWESTLRMYAGPVIGKTPVDQITVEDILKVLQPIWTDKPETASRLRGRIEKVLGWATAMKFRTGDNPADWSGALGHLLPAISKVQTVVHHKAVPYDEVPALMRELRQNDSVSAKALMFTILTVSRTSEVLGAKPEEFDFINKVWTIPATRMKAGREHRVPLTDAAIAIINSVLERLEKYVFHNGSGRKLADIYLGYDSMLTICEGNPRFTIQLLRPLAKWFSGTRSPVPREVQADVLQSNTAKFLSLLSSIPTPGGRTVVDVLDVIGERLSGEVNGLSFKAEPALSIRVDKNLPDETLEALGRALNQGAFVMLTDGKDEGAYDFSSLRGARLRLSYMLCPRYHLPLTYGQALNASSVLLPRKENDARRELSIFDILDNLEPGNGAP